MFYRSLLVHIRVLQRFTATVKASNEDESFGYYSRPSKAVVV